MFLNMKNKREKEVFIFNYFICNTSMIKEIDFEQNNYNESSHRRKLASLIFLAHIRKMIKS